MTSTLFSHPSLETRSCVHKHFLRAGDVTEIYLTAFAHEELPFAEQASLMFEELANELRAHDAYVFEEHVFATASAQEALCAARLQAYGILDDGVPPTWLLAPGGDAKIMGVQVHAVAGCGLTDVLLLDGQPLGRVLQHRGAKRVSLSGLSGGTHGSPQVQYAIAFEKAQRLLLQVGMEFQTVARTWWWMRDILQHYDVFNRVRREFFTRVRNSEAENRNAAGEQDANRKAFTPPASTGIGVFPKHGGFCSLDVIAAAGDGVETKYFQGAGNQRAASEYGSAFARASRIDALGTSTIYVSGTADIDPEGRTCNIGNAAAQIDATLKNVEAVLKGQGCSMDDIVNACAYSKSPEIEKIWKAHPLSRRLPAVPVVADVCRDNLLFELEATALVRTPGYTRIKPN